MRTIIAFLAGWGLACVAMNYTRKLDRLDHEWEMWNVQMERQP